MSSEEYNNGSENISGCHVLSLTNDNKFGENVKELIKWHKENAGVIRLPDNYIPTLLHFCNNDFDLGKQTINSACDFILDNIEMFRNLNPLLPEFQEMHTFLETALLTKPDIEGNQVILFRISNKDPSTFDFPSFVRLVLTFICSLLCAEGKIHGYTVVVDANNVSFGHFRRVCFRLWMRFLQFNDILPTFLQRIHIINVYYVSKVMFNILRPFLSKNLFGKTHLHSNNLESFYKSVPKDILPLDYGGKEVSMDVLKELSVKFLEDNIANIIKL